MPIKKSFSLIEVLIFVTILTLFLITSVTIVIVSMHQNTLRIETLQAIHYNGQLLDWVRSEKETDWNVFAPTAGNNTYCFLNSTWTVWPMSVADENSCSYTLNGMFRRYVKFTTTLSGGVPTQVEAMVHSDWKEGNNTYSTKLDTVFTIWEE